VQVIAGVTAVLVALGATLWVSGPHQQVPLPPDDASPEQVVTAYLDALAARDFETANAIDPRTHLDRFSHPVTFVDVTGVRSQVNGDDAYVGFVATIENNDGSFNDRQPWGFTLERDAGRWQIVEAGVG